MLLGLLETDVFAPENCSPKKRSIQTPVVAYAAVAFDPLHPETSMRHSAKPHCMSETQEALLISLHLTRHSQLLRCEYCP